MKGLIAVAALQVGAMFGWALQNERVIATAPTFRIPLQPRDPYDVLRGRYFIMNPKDSWIRPGAEDAPLPMSELKRFLGSDSLFMGPALVGFCPQGDAFRVCALRRVSEPADASAQHWSRARVVVSGGRQRWSNGKMISEPGDHVNVDLGLDRFFLPNRAVLPGRENEPGWEVEVYHRPGQSPLPRRLFFHGQPVVLE